MERIERPKEVIRAEANVQSDEFIQKNAQEQLNRIYDFLDGLVDLELDVMKESVSDLLKKSIDTISNTTNKNITFLSSSYIDNKKDYGFTLRVGYSDLTVWNGDTYWLSCDFNGRIGLGVQINGATSPSWYIK